MSLLFDANLSPRLVAKLADAFPGSAHVAEVGLTLTDVEVWRLAAARGLAIVTKDADFQHLAVFTGEAKVVWIRLGNCRTELVESLLGNAPTGSGHSCTTPASPFSRSPRAANGWPG